MDILMHPWVPIGLLMLAAFFIVREMFVPARGLFGLLGALCLLFYVGVALWAKRTDAMSLGFFAAGIIACLFELATPGFGVFGIAGGVMLFLAVFEGARSPGEGILSILAAIGVALFSAYVYRRLGYHMHWLDRQILKTANGTEEGFVARKDPPETLLGKRAIAQTNLRPSGTVLLDGARMEAITTGEFIASGSEVVVLSVDHGKLTVRLMPKETQRTENEETFKN